MSESFSPALGFAGTDNFHTGKTEAGIFLLMTIMLTEVELEEAVTEKFKEVLNSTVKINSISVRIEGEYIIAEADVEGVGF